MGNPPVAVVADARAWLWSWILSWSWSWSRIWSLALVLVSKVKVECSVVSITESGVGCFFVLMRRGACRVECCCGSLLPTRVGMCAQRPRLACRSGPNAEQGCRARSLDPPKIFCSSGDHDPLPVFDHGHLSQHSLATEVFVVPQQANLNRSPCSAAS